MKKIFCFLLTALLLFAGCVYAGDAVWMLGDKSPEIQAVQIVLTDLGYYDGDCGGLFGTRLQNALAAFQQDAQLPVTGQIDSETLAELSLSNESPAASFGKLNADTPLRLKASTSSETLAQLFRGTAVQILSTKNTWCLIRLEGGVVGYVQTRWIDVFSTGPVQAYDGQLPETSLACEMSGSDVLLLQERLKALGFFRQSITGYFGSVTLAAVQAFQKANGLTPNGVASLETLDVLFSANALPSEETIRRPQSPAKAFREPPFVPLSADDETLAAALVEYALQFVDVPYVSGGKSPKGFDCSGFVSYVYEAFGFTIPRTAYYIGYSNVGQKIPTMSELRLGDVICFNTLPDRDRSDHVGIYVGNMQVIHAGYSSGRILVSDLTGRYYTRYFSWGKRLIGVENRK